MGGYNKLSSCASDSTLAIWEWDPCRSGKGRLMLLGNSVKSGGEGDITKFPIALGPINNAFFWLLFSCYLVARNIAKRVLIKSYYSRQRIILDMMNRYAYIRAHTRSSCRELIGHRYNGEPSMSTWVSQVLKTEEKEMMTRSHHVQAKNLGKDMLIGVVALFSILWGAVQPASSSGLDFDITLEDIVIRPNVTTNIHLKVFVNELQPCDGKVIFAVHGFAHTAATWGPFAEAISRTTLPVGRCVRSWRSTCRGTGGAVYPPVPCFSAI